MVPGTEVQIFQDLPTTLLRNTKDSDFLRQILQKKNIKYCWRIPFTLEVQLLKGRISMIGQAKQLAEELLTGSTPEDPQDSYRPGEQNNKGTPDNEEGKLDQATALIQDVYRCIYKKYIGMCWKCNKVEGTFYYVWHT